MRYHTFEHQRIQDTFEWATPLLDLPPPPNSQNQSRESFYTPRRGDRKQYTLAGRFSLDYPSDGHAFIVSSKFLKYKSLSKSPNKRFHLRGRTRDATKEASHPGEASLVGLCALARPIPTPLLKSSSSLCFPLHVFVFVRKYIGEG